jgi:hypothetical protein
LEKAQRSRNMIHGSQGAGRVGRGAAGELEPWLVSNSAYISPHGTDTAVG